MYYIYIFFFEFFIEARSQPGTPLFNLKIIISVCDTHEIRTYNKGQHQKLIRRFMFSGIRATHTRYARTMKGKKARSQPGTPLFKLKIIISVCDTHEIRTYNKGQHQKLIRRFMFSGIRATHTRYARTMKGKIPITKKKN